MPDYSDQDIEEDELVDWCGADPDDDDEESPGACDEMSQWDLGEPTLEDGGEDEEEWPF